MMEHYAASFLPLFLILVFTFPTVAAMMNSTSTSSPASSSETPTPVMTLSNESVSNTTDADDCSFHQYETCSDYATCETDANGTFKGCVCQEGYTGDGLKAGTGCKTPDIPCVEIDTCQDYNRKCVDGICVCMDGYQPTTPPTEYCEDIDECALGLCDVNANCQNYPGGYTCTCKALYVGDGKNCSFQCEVDNHCHAQASCKFGKCECDEGYEGDGRFSCVDINECETGEHDCHSRAICTNTEGSYTCTCINGYHGSGFACTAYPKTCQEILDKKPSSKTGFYEIDPDGTGDLDHVWVICRMRPDGLGLTEIEPINRRETTYSYKPDYNVQYNISVPHIREIIDNSGFCTQKMWARCPNQAVLMNGDDYWIDGNGNQQYTFGGATVPNKCACGQLGYCKTPEAGCYCDGTGEVIIDEGKILDKSLLPVQTMHMQLDAGQRVVFEMQTVVCGARPFDFPKHCDEAKFNLNIKDNGPLVIDIDGEGPGMPVLVYCDMETYPHVGITQIPNTYYTPVVVDSPTEITINYTIQTPDVQRVIDNSKFCRQYVEYNCMDSPLTGATFTTMGGQELAYFPGGGEGAACACGLLGSCDSPDVECNCNIQDGVSRWDLGTVFDKSLLPITSVNIPHAAGNASFTISHLQCGEQQFGFEASCEPYLRKNVNYTYTYFIDPDGPTPRQETTVVNVEPFLVQCIFEENPQYAITVVHHNYETYLSSNANGYTFTYKGASFQQVDSLTQRSVYCTQSLDYKCEGFAPVHSLSGDSTLVWSGVSGVVQTYFNGNEGGACGCNETMSCAGGGVCNCDAIADTIDSGVLTNKDDLPVVGLAFTETQTASVRIGELRCYEMSPTCTDLDAFMQKGSRLESEYDVGNDNYIIDPDGPGGVEPFVVYCKFPQTIVYIIPESSNDTSAPTGDQPEEKCFELTYANGATRDQIKALMEASDYCTQHISYTCLNAPWTDHVHYKRCGDNGLETVQGWGGSDGKDNCGCGITGTCEGGKDAMCNCDLEDGVEREDAGWIHDKDLLPVCEICMTLDPLEPNMLKRASSYRVSSLMCNRNPIGLFKSCQDRRDAGTKESSTEFVDPDGFGTGNPAFPVYCNMNIDPAYGSMEIHPREEFLPIPPDGIVVVIYFVYNLTYTKAVVEEAEFCEQEIYVLCGNAALPDRDEGRQLNDWIPVAGGITCREGACNCQGDEVYGGFVTEDFSLPVGEIKLPPGSTGRVAVRPMSCFDVYRDCQEILDNRATTNTNGDDRYAIDPDGAGGVGLFGVTCEFPSTVPIGITRVTVNQGLFKVIGQTEPGEGEYPVDYPGVTPEQINKLAEISGFCHQGIQYECKESPVIGDNNPAYTYYTGYNDQPSSSFGTGNQTDVTGCSCVLTDTCPEGKNCQCDATGSMVTVDYGAVTDRSILPIQQINAGGQTTDTATADITVTDVRCAPTPFDLPLDCEAAYKRGYRLSGSLLIWPSPDVDPFFVYCDFDSQPGHGITIIGNNREDPTNITYTETSVIPVEYPNVTPEQIEALISVSKSCYQPVKYSCYNTLFIENDMFYWVGKDNKQFTYFGDSDSAAGGCSCGQYCGGDVDEATLRDRKCSCDAGEEQWRSDSGAFKVKEDLPVVSMVFKALPGRNASGFVELGKLYCQQTTYDINECTTGYNDCNERANCKNTNTGFECHCQQGFEGIKVPDVWANGRNCYDDNECLTGICPTHEAECTNTIGSFTCTCKPGFLQTGLTTCQDINECENPDLNNCHANAKCINTHGGYYCRCRRGYKGDGVNCTSIGICACFGDPHCQSFDGKWLHYQGDCQYTMAKDGCDGTKPSFEVLIKNWNRGYAEHDISWVETVTVIVENHVIELMQRHEVRVDDLTKSMPYKSPNETVYITRSGLWVHVHTNFGVQVNWDGSQAVELLISNDYQKKTCGFCGNYNLDPVDDWTVGPACPGNAGEVTENESVFGNSYVVAEYAAKFPRCQANCFEESPSFCSQETLSTSKVFCDKIFNNDKFKQCIAAMDVSVVDTYRFSCQFDLCHVSNMETMLCDFASQLVKDCRESYNITIVDWRQDVMCQVECGENMMYSDCGDPNSQKSCMEVLANSELPASEVTCEEGCFCNEGMMLSGEQCVPREECGCLYMGEYYPIGAQVTIGDCEELWTCTGDNVFSKVVIDCSENATCTIQDGTFGCHCKEGYMGNGTYCVFNPCGSNPCDHLPNADCVPQGDNYYCRCAMGFTGDCHNCEDIDECATQEDDCPLHATCVNTVGSFRCECRPGTVRIGTICEDIDECKIPANRDSCAEGLECLNKYGSYACGECQARSPEGKCCVCRGYGCDIEGPVCGSDGETYESYADLKINRCKLGLRYKDLKVDYLGPCKETCATGVVCESVYQECVDNAQSGFAECICKPCNASTDPILMQTPVCDPKHRIIFPNICSFQEFQCEMGRSDPVPVIDITQCTGPGGADSPVTTWTEWSGCSVTCGNGVLTRTRQVVRELNEVQEAAFEMDQTAVCYNEPCIDSVCSNNDCEENQVCVPDGDEPVCECPDCSNQTDDPVCARVGDNNLNFDNLCEAKLNACENNLPMQYLNKGECGIPPVNCTKMPDLVIVKGTSSTGYACRTPKVDRGVCDGGCGRNSNLCCQPRGGFKSRSVTLNCDDGTTIEKNFQYIDDCECITAPKES